MISSQEKTSYKWTLVTNQAAFAPRDGAGALVFKDRMWLLGGWNPRDEKNFPSDCNSEIWSSVDGAKWEFVTHAPWEERHTAGYVVYKDKMWIVGGDPIQNHYQNDVWNTEDGINWVQVTSDVPWKDRILHYTLVHDDKIWVMGGQSVTSRVRKDIPRWALPVSETYYNDIWNTTDGVNWTRITEHASWPPRGQIGGSAVFSNRIWILGGGTYCTDYFADVWSSRDGKSWEKHVECAPWRPRQYHDVAVFDGKMWVLEGAIRKSSQNNDVWYSSDGVNWHELPATPWKPRHAASVFVYKGALWMVAGNSMDKEIWKLTCC